MNIQPASPKPTLATAPAPAPAATPGTVRLEVPIEVPAEMYVPDPETGRLPIDSYHVQLIPKDAQLAPADALITNAEEVQKLVQQVRDETLPEGMVPKVGDSDTGVLAAKGKAMVGSFGQMAGGLGVYSLAGMGSFGMSAGLAAGAAGVGGAIGLMMGFDQLKDALDAKSFYEGMKARGTETLPVPALVKNEEGKSVVGVKEMPIDKVIAGARDRAIGSGIGMVASTAMIAAALGAPPVVALGAVVLGVAGAVFGMKGVISAVARKLFSKVANLFQREGKEGAVRPEVVPAGSKEVAAARDAQPTAPALQSVSAGQPLSSEEIQGISSRILELQGELLSNPEVASTLQELQEVAARAAVDPQAADELAQVEGRLAQDPVAGPIFQEIEALQTRLMEDPGFQQMLAEGQARAAAQQGAAS